MSTTSSSSAASSDINVAGNVTSIKTPDEMLFEGLKLAGIDAAMQKRQPKSNLRDFIDRYGSSPLVLSIVWYDLQVTSHPEAFVPVKKCKFEHFFVAMHFLRQCPIEMERKAAYSKLTLRRETMRKWIWFFVGKVEGLKHQKIIWPEDHILGDDIWVLTVDCTMSSSWERVGEETVKDPKNYSFKHHSAGYNCEAAISVKESRCIWIGKKPGPAGEDVDLVLFRKPGGLEENLLAIGKKGIADGGYGGERDLLSTPNGHDLASVRKFKSRALKRHEKFNSIFKCFKCLSHKFRHTRWQSEDEQRDRYGVCFGACAVLFQCQLENGQLLYNIFVGDMQVPFNI